jgi:hypothetical protein
MTGPLLEAGETLVEESLAPLADDLSGHVQTRCNDLVRKAFRRQQNHLRSNDVSIR